MSFNWKRGLAAGLIIGAVLFVMLRAQGAFADITVENPNLDAERVVNAAGTEWVDGSGVSWVVVTSTNTVRGFSATVENLVIPSGTTWWYSNTVGTTVYYASPGYPNLVFAPISWTLALGAPAHSQNTAFTATSLTLYNGNVDDDVFLTEVFKDVVSVVTNSVTLKDSTSGYRNALMPANVQYSLGPTTTVALVSGKSVYRVNVTNSTVLAFDFSGLGLDGTQNRAAWETELSVLHTGLSVSLPTTNSLAYYYLTAPVLSTTVSNQVIYMAWRASATNSVIGNQWLSR